MAKHKYKMEITILIIWGVPSPPRFLLHGVMVDMCKQLPQHTHLNALNQCKFGVCCGALPDQLHASDAEKCNTLISLVRQVTLIQAHWGPLLFIASPLILSETRPFMVVYIPCQSCDHAESAWLKGRQGPTLPCMDACMHAPS